MKNNFLLLLISFFALLVAQCKFKDNKNIVNLKGINLMPVDTVKVKYPGDALMLSDIRKNKFIFFDFFSHEIIISDLKGNILFKFDNSLLGADDFGNTLLGARFQSDSTIAIVSNEGYFIYNFRGKIVSKFKHSVEVSKAYITGDFKFAFDYKRNMFVSLLNTGTDRPSNVPDFYEKVNHITLFKIDSQKQLSRVKYEPESSYLQKEYYTSDWGAHFDLDKDSIAVIYGRDPIIYIYGLSNFHKVTSFNTEPEHFAIRTKFKFGENTSSNHKLRLTSFANSSYRKIFSRGDTIIATYNGGIPIDKFEHIETLSDLNNIAYKEQHYYLQIFIKGRKEALDFELPKEFPFADLLSNGRIILTQQEKLDNKKDGYRRFLIMKLSFN